MTSRRALDFVLYILLAVGLVALVLLVAAYTDWFDNDRLVRWGGLAAHTAIVFGYAIRSRKPLLTQPSFWAVLLVLLAAHLGLLIYVLANAKEWKAVWFAFLVPIESTAIGAVLILTGHRAARSG